MKEKAITYNAPKRRRSKKAMAEDQVIQQAMDILHKRLKRKPGDEGLTNPESAIELLKLHLTEREREVFAILFLDSHHRLIEYSELFTGTMMQRQCTPAR